MTPHDHPPDVPAYAAESAITVSLDRRRCSDCGATSNPPHRAVADFPDPTSEDPRDRWRCLDCYASLIGDRTSLDEERSKVLALELAGYSHDQIGTAIGRSATRIERWARDIRDTYRGVQSEYETLSALFEYY